MTKRDYFDKQVEWVLAALPRKVLKMLEEVPLHVEDRPSKQLMKTLQIEYDDELCGYFSGIPLDRKQEMNARLPNSVTIFRKGIVAESLDESGKVHRNELRRQIRITILHELAHYHGIGEEELEMLGYG
ncbi:MAG: metallopeptidase family protein [Planctomycetaceae bacterium]|jgi:predicted Zn-dependent protease with MMP-like domain|nr:metallopeptidase family protein [Planctomycetaceae bacterium]